MMKMIGISLVLMMSCVVVGSLVARQSNGRGDPPYPGFVTIDPKMNMKWYVTFDNETIRQAIAKNTAIEVEDRDRLYALSAIGITVYSESEWKSKGSGQSLPLKQLATRKYVGIHLEP